MQIKQKTVKTKKSKILLLRLLKNKKFKQPMVCN